MTKVRPDRRCVEVTSLRAELALKCAYWCNLFIVT